MLQWKGEKFHIFLIKTASQSFTIIFPIRWYLYILLRHHLLCVLDLFAYVSIVLSIIGYLHACFIIVTR